MIRYISVFSLILALIVVMFGAYTRLSDAGLGCPDWPGCYGHFILPLETQQLKVAQNNYPQILIEKSKAWTEMIHRYAAGSLGILIFLLAGYCIWQRYKGEKFPWILPLTLVGLVIFQAALGMWTVTLKLLPIVVMSHLLGGIIIFSCLTCLFLQLSQITPLSLKKWHKWWGLGALIVFLQVALGGWVSANYAGIACVGFPQCNGQWLPALDLVQGFNVFSSVGENYQGGVLSNELRITIHYIHRIGAVITLSYLLILGSMLLSQVRVPIIRSLTFLILILVCCQFILGIMNVIYLLPLAVAVAHNGVAALLMAAMLGMFYLTGGRNKDVN